MSMFGSVVGGGECGVACVHGGEKGTAVNVFSGYRYWCVGQDRLLGVDGKRKRPTSLTPWPPDGGRVLIDYRIGPPFFGAAS